jgi:hypothetical protein
MLLDQLDDLSTRIDQVTALLEAAITALTPPQAGTDTPTGDGDGGGDGASAQPATGRYVRAVERLCAIPGAGPDTVRAVIGESGRRGALLRRAPLRTVHATRRRTRLKQAAKALRWWCWPPAFGPSPAPA